MLSFMKDHRQRTNPAAAIALCTATINTGAQRRMAAAAIRSTFHFRSYFPTVRFFLRHDTTPPGSLIFNSTGICRCNMTAR